MAARKKRPVLYEVYRPRPRGETPASTPRPAAPKPPSPVEPAASPPPARVPPVRSRERSTPIVSLSGPVLAVVIAVVVVLLFVSFSAGRRYEALHPGVIPPQGAADEAAALADSGPAGAAADSAGKAGGEASESAAADSPETKTVATRQPAAADRPPPRVTLHRGYDYVIVQHFGKKRKDATGVARFLREQGIECALLDGRDIRLVVTEPFLTRQADKAAARAERQRADKLMRRIRQLGRELAKQWAAQGRPGYTLDGCYLYEIK